MRNIVLCIGVFLFSCLLFGCKKEGEEPKSVASCFLQEDNYIDCQTGMECSAFSSAYILRHFGEKADGVAIYKEMPDKMSDGGVLPSSIVELFEARGYKAEFKCNGTIEDLKQEILTGNPVIVFIHIKEPYTSVHETHYVPMVGYDKDYIYIAESVRGMANCLEEEKNGYNRKIGIEQFERLWSNIDGVYNQPYFVIRKGV